MDKVVPLGNSVQHAVRQLFYWARGGQTNFTALLYDLIAKADPQNLARLRRAFPAEVTAWEKWHLAENPAEFFRSYGVNFNDSEA